MSTTKAILQQVQTVLKADADLSAYVADRVHILTRRNVPPEQFPIIFLDPDRVRETYPAYPKADGRMTILVSAYARAPELDTQVVGDANYKGILDLEKDIKLALGRVYPTLNDTVVEFTFPETAFVSREDLSSEVVLGVVVTVELHYRTQLDLRT